MDTALDFGIFLPDSKLGQRSYSRCTDDGIFQHDSVVYVAYVLGWLCSLWPLHTQEMQDANSEFSEFAVLDELAEMCKSCGSQLSAR